MAAKKMTQTLDRDQSNHPGRTSAAHAPGLLGESPIIGLILFLFGGLFFGAMALNLKENGPLLAWDRALATTLPAAGLSSPPFVQTIMNAGFYLGEQVIAVLTILSGIYFVFKRLWKELAMLVVGMGGESLLFFSLTGLFARPRPPTQIWILIHLPGFPSGHAMSVVIFYGLLAYLLVPKIRSGVGKAAVIAAALFLILFVGFSRIFTAGHYLTDILAGYAVGLTWAAFAFTIIEVIFLKIRSRNVQKES